jgi:hypothetical protein
VLVTKKEVVVEVEAAGGWRQRKMKMKIPEEGMHLGEMPLFKSLLC